MSGKGRVAITELRRVILLNLDEEIWRTPQDYFDALRRTGRKLGGNDWYRIALVLERLANDGLAEVEVSGRVRRFRRAA